MAQTLVPASTSVRVSRVHNIDTDRLIRRHGFLVAMFDTDHPIDRRRTYVQTVRELHTIENELEDRGFPQDRLTERYQPG